MRDGEGAKAACKRCGVSSYKTILVRDKVDDEWYCGICTNIREEARARAKKALGAVEG